MLASLYPWLIQQLNQNYTNREDIEVGIAATPNSLHVVLFTNAGLALATFDCQTASS